MIWPNRPATRWQERAILTATRTGDDLTMTWRRLQYFTNGAEYIPGVHGILVTIEIEHNVATIIDSWSIDIVTPWGSASASGTGGLPDIEVLLDWDNRAITVDGSCNADHTFDGLEVTYTLDGGADVPLLSIGPQTESFAGFDKRLCCQPEADTEHAHGLDAGHSAVIFTRSAPSGPPACTELGDCVDRPGNELEVTAQGVPGAVYGWRWWEDAAWVMDAIVWDTSFSPAQACPPCKEGFGAVSATDSWAINFETRGYYSRTVVADGTNEYISTCFGFPIDFFYRYWQLLEEVREYATAVSAYPSNFGVPVTERTTDSICNGVSGTPTDDITTETQTLSGFFQQVVHLVGTRDCGCKSSGAGAFCSGDSPCTVWGFCDSAGSFCQWFGERSLYHPQAPACLGTALWPWNFETRDGRLFRTDIRDGDVWVYASPFHIPPGGVFPIQTQVTSSQDCIRPTIAEDTRRRLHLTYTRLDGSDNPSAFHRWSDDDAESFGTETALPIPDGKYTTCNTDEDGNVIFAALVYLSGTSGPGNVFVQFWGSGVPYSSLSAPVMIVDDAAAAIPFIDTTFHISPAHHGGKAWILSAVVDGETDTSEWQCFHEDDWSFKRIT